MNINKLYSNFSVTCQFITFSAGRRPLDEIIHAGQGSSDNTLLILNDADEISNYAYLIFTIEGLNVIPSSLLQECRLIVNLSLCDSNGNGMQEKRPIAEWTNKIIEPMVFEKNRLGNVSLHPIKMEEMQGQRLIFRIEPNKDLVSSEVDYYSFENCFTQMLMVELELLHENNIITRAQTLMKVVDMRKLGSLYQRLFDDIIKPDTLSQVAKNHANVDYIDYTYHPWYLFYVINAMKNALYKNALIDDIAYKKHHLTDPQWLLQIGIYQEILTCMGIFEAIKDRFGDLLTEKERAAYVDNAHFTALRKYVNVEGWRKVWELHDIAFPSFGIPKTGPVSATNILHKERAVLASLSMQSLDMKQAIQLAGYTTYNIEESWQRIFRDAERAVLMKTEEGLPELAFLPLHLKEYILWHRNETIDFSIIKWIQMLLGKQKGLYTLFCETYLEELNDTACWAKRRLLVDYHSDPCIGTGTSLHKAYYNKQYDYFNKLQTLDGFTSEINIEIKPAKESKYSSNYLYTLLEHNSIFSVLNEEELAQLTLAAHTLMLAPEERITIQGREGSSLYIVGEGHLEVLYRHENSEDFVINEMMKGDIFGEISLLTNSPRSATVRAVAGAVVFEITKERYDPIMKANPLLSDQLVSLMKQRLEFMRKFKRNLQQQKQSQAKEIMPSLMKKIRRFFGGS